MTKREFNAMTNIVKTATASDPIWWEGYSWLKLNRSQIKRIVEVLKENPVITKEGNKLMFPSGLTINA